MTLDHVWVAALIAAASALAGWASYLHHRRKAQDERAAGSVTGRITAQSAHDLATSVGANLANHVRDFTEHRVRTASDLAELRSQSAANARSFEATEARLERSIAAVHTDVRDGLAAVGRDMRAGFAALGDRVDRVDGRIDALHQGELDRRAVPPREGG